LAAGALLGVPGPAIADGSGTQPVYRANDFAGGQASYIDPAGQDGLVSLAELPQAQNGSPPPHSGDQVALYNNLLYGTPQLSDGDISNFYLDGSFGVKAGDVARVEQPEPSVPVTIYRDRYDVPHIYGDTRAAMAFGAGYAAAEDRLFLMDISRHLGAGHLSEFAGPSCSNEQMDNVEVRFGAYTQDDIDKMTNALAANQFGPLGVESRQLALALVDGINRYISVATQPQNVATMVPADYFAIQKYPPQAFTLTDLVHIGLVAIQANGIGGGGEVANAALLQYLEKSFPGQGLQMFNDFKDTVDADTPKTIIDKSFPYMADGQAAPTPLNAIPDDASQPLTGGPPSTTTGCDPPSTTSAHSSRLLAAIFGAAAVGKHGKESNELVVGAARTASGHPIAVFGPQVGYYSPEVLMEEDLHAPDFDAMGVSFPGTNDVVELGRGRDFAWSATDSGADSIDQRLELTFSDSACSKSSSPPQSNHFYLFQGRCLAMELIPDQYVAYPTPGGTGGPALINHDMYRTVHGLVQGWTTANKGHPVAVVNQRSTYMHDTQSVVGFLRWNRPSYTHDAASWLEGARAMNTNGFNWMYVDAHDVAYYSTGLFPARNPGADYSLPTWGTGVAEWSGFLSDAAHPQEMNPGRGYFVQWNNTQAPGWAQADNDYSRTPVYRSQMLSDNLDHQLALHGGKLPRSDVVRAMEGAASTDMTARYLLPELPGGIAAHAPSNGTGVANMLAQLNSWLQDGAHRLKAHSDDAQYQHPAAIAIMDEVFPRLVRALFDPVFSGAGSATTFDGLPTGYPILPLEFESSPNGNGGHQGDAYGGGWEGYVWKVLRQLQGRQVAVPFSDTVLSHLCVGAAPSVSDRCLAAIAGAFTDAYAALVNANGSGDVASWTQDTQTKWEGNHATPQTTVTMPQFDNIQYISVGVIGQPNMDWQNRPTYQQVVEFPSHTGDASGGMPLTGPMPPAAGLFLILIGLLLASSARGRRPRAP
jgi:acyl-homoserine lactone acylase PvdQ